MIKKYLNLLFANKWIKYIILFMVFILIIFVLPFILNSLILMPKQFEIVGNGKDWLIFWATFFSAIASSIMAIITWLTLKQNNNQLTELKRQWEEDHTANLFISIIKGVDGYYLNFENISNCVAKNITFTISREFIDKCTIPSLKELLENNGKENFNILPKSSKRFYLSTLKDNDSLYIFQNPGTKNKVESRDKKISILMEYKLIFKMLMRIMKIRKISLFL